MKQLSITIALALICTIANAQNIKGSNRSGDGSLIRPELRKETTKQNHKRVMRPRSRIQTTGPNNGHQLRDYSKSSNRSENRPLIYKEAQEYHMVLIID